jgi:hypothetical protein
LRPIVAPAPLSHVALPQFVVEQDVVAALEQDGFEGDGLAAAAEIDRQVVPLDHETPVRRLAERLHEHVADAVDVVLLQVFPERQDRGTEQAIGQRAVGRAEIARAAARGLVEDETAVVADRDLVRREAVERERKADRRDRVVVVVELKVGAAARDVDERGRAAAVEAVREDRVGGRRQHAVDVVRVHVVRGPRRYRRFRGHRGDDAVVLIARARRDRGRRVREDRARDVVFERVEIQRRGRVVGHDIAIVDRVALGDLQIRVGAARALAGIGAQRDRKTDAAPVGTLRGRRRKRCLRKQQRKQRRRHRVYELIAHRDPPDDPNGRSGVSHAAARRTFAIDSTSISDR